MFVKSPATQKYSSAGIVKKSSNYIGTQQVKDTIYVKIAVELKTCHFVNVQNNKL